MDEDAAVDESPPTSPARSVRARAASPPAAERKEEVDISKHVAMMRARSKENDLEGAMQVFRKLLGEMAENNIQANQVTYNEMLNALVTVKDRKEMWALVREMNAMGMRPNSV